MEHEFKPIESSLLSGHHYDPGTRVLTVKLRNGSIYAYEDVPIEKVEALTGGNQSPGRYFNERIKANHVGRKVSDG